MTKKGNAGRFDVPVRSAGEAVQGSIVGMGKCKFYRISHYNLMPPFFMTLTGAGDHWMFISSNGALTAGRRDPSNALFPYTTDDKITDSAGNTGSLTVFRIGERGKEVLWEPFSSESHRTFAIQRNLYKSIYGNILIFEEIH